MDLLYKVKKNILTEGLIEKGDRVLVGVSGGIDSTTLLWMLTKLRESFPFEIAVSHVNHQLRGLESKRDEEFVRSMASGNSLPCHVVKVDVVAYAAKKGLSLQHAGRDLRYGYFSETAHRFGYNKIALAHILDDQVETFLLRLLKGTGIRGLASIPNKRDMIIRPLLNVYRREIERFADDKKIVYVEDSSNEENHYERNFIRNRLMPVMGELNPAFREKICALLNDFASLNASFEKTAEVFLEKEGHFHEGEIYLGVDASRGLDPEVRFRVISRVVSSLEPGFTPLRRHITLVEGILMGRGPNLFVSLPRGVRVKRVYDRLVFTKKKAAITGLRPVPVSAGKNRIEEIDAIVEIKYVDPSDFSIGGGDNRAFLDAGKTGDLSIRGFMEGDRFIPMGMTSPVKLKDFFISRKIPREKRRATPLLVSGGDIIWVVGHRIDERYKVTGETKRLLQVEITRGEWEG